MGNKMKRKQQFIKFLKDNTAYEEFMFNFESKKGKYFRTNRGIVCSTKSYFDTCLMKNYLIDAFLWGITLQKYNYWSSLNRKWFELLKKK